MSATWKGQLEKKLIKDFGVKKGGSLYKKYAEAFSHSYHDEYDVVVASHDIGLIEKISADDPITICFYLSSDKESPLHLRLFQWQKPIPLFDILPMLENLDLRTYNERSNKVQLSENHEVWISDFAVSYSKGSFEIDKVESLFQDAFIAIYDGLAENDGFNKLVLGAFLSWREITILRAYAKYLRQVRFRFSQSYIERALVNNAVITRNLVNLFLTMNNPAKQTKAKSQAEQIEKDILAALDAVSSLDEDKIIRRLLALIKASVRTNYFQLDKKGNNKPYLSIKLHSPSIPDLPLPVPLYEIFVYSARFEAIHLRAAKVARGGIRWSDRLEDFRTEVLGLMKAQKVKNAIIVPSGAKGGFVLKKDLSQASRENLQIEVVECYTLFIKGLLDLTDNIKDKKCIRPPQVVCHDDEDFYLVVAADKGTATFSDIANDIAAEYNFWLGDAFASGGATGYDHKKMGITARGAWESIKRHFRELDINISKTDITVVGIGDMSGDVFGNGMIYSHHIKLVAAFDHRHIFIDPDPDTEDSYKERVRLFNLPISSWEDYNPKLISKGGGVFKRSLKSITLTPQMKKTLDVTDNTLAPNELIRAILKSPVDLLYNGGIGTYVKASTESTTEVGDRANDYNRVDGGELRCRVVGEGGNLGFTQLGRIEYALKGGLINTDFIDNSAGVDCSDHEVNLKILLDQEVHKKKLTMEKRNEILASLTDEVAELVLSDNYHQALVMSFSAHSAKNMVGLHANYIKDLETLGVLNRQVEFLPDSKQLAERKAVNEGLTRPELAVLLAYTKIYIKHSILESDAAEDPYLSQIVETAFPLAVRKKYETAMYEHRLHRDIIATQLSNQIVNEMGITFVYRLQEETGASVGEIVRAQVVASKIFQIRELQKVIEALDFKVPLAEQYEMLANLRNLTHISSRWFLHSKHLLKDDLGKLIAHFSTRVNQLENMMPDLMSGETKNYLGALTQRFVETGLPKETATKIAAYRAIYTSLNIIEVATRNNFDLVKTAKVYFAAGERINLVWFRDQLSKDSRDGHWNIVARLTLRDELDLAQRALAVAIIKHDSKQNHTDELIEDWLESNAKALQRWENLLAMLHSSPNIDYTMFFIAMRELIGFVQATQ